MPEQSGFPINDSVSPSLFEYYSFGILSLGSRDSECGKPVVFRMVLERASSHAGGVNCTCVGCWCDSRFESQPSSKEIFTRGHGERGRDVKNEGRVEPHDKVIVYLIVFTGLLVVSVWSILRKT